MSMEVFARVAESGSFTAASKKLGISVSGVTKNVARLEDALGTQLLKRSTRRMVLTDYGEAYYERCIRILSDVDEAEAAMRRSAAAPQGLVRVLMPYSFGRVTMVPALPAFQERYPEIRLDLTFQDWSWGVDLIENRFDLAVRLGEARGSQLITRILTQGPQLTVASPGFLARHGRPRQPEELVAYRCVAHREHSTWLYRGEQGERIEVRVRGDVILSSGDALREAAAAGVGIAYGTWWLFRKDLAAGSVVPILEEFGCDGAPVSIYYPERRHLPAKVRAVIDFLVEITKPG